MNLIQPVGSKPAIPVYVPSPAPAPQPQAAAVIVNAAQPILQAAGSAANRTERRLPATVLPIPAPALAPVAVVLVQPQPRPQPVVVVAPAPQPMALARGLPILPLASVAAENPDRQQVVYAYLANGRAIPIGGINVISPASLIREIPRPLYPVRIPYTQAGRDALDRRF